MNQKEAQIKTVLAEVVLISECNLELHKTFQKLHTGTVDAAAKKQLFERGIEKGKAINRHLDNITQAFKAIADNPN